MVQRKNEAFSERSTIPTTKNTSNAMKQQPQVSQWK